MLTYADLNNHIVVAEKLHCDIERIKFTNYYIKILTSFIMLLALYPYFPIYINILLAGFIIPMYCGIKNALSQKIKDLNILIFRIDELKGITTMTDLEKNLFEIRMSHIGFK